jgi:GDP-4-dehydro-6-deoxy-D-mannose reductase
MRALVTGSTGFTGRVLVTHLRQQGVEVACISAVAPRPGIGAADFSDPEAVCATLLRIRPTHILHLSGALDTGNLSSALLANALHGAVLLDAVRRSGLEVRTLLVGSAAEYGPLNKGQVPATEQMPAHPVTPYGCAKLAQTQLALASGLPVVVARPSNIIGPDMPSSLAIGRFAAALAKIARGDAPPVLRVGDLSAIRDFIDVQDAARLYWDLLNAPAALGQVVNVATGVGVSMEVALTQLIEAFGVDAQVVQGQAGSARSGATSTFVADISRLQDLIGQQHFTPLGQSMKRIAANPRPGV